MESMLLERYRDLIIAVQRRAAELGIKLVIDSIPSQRHFPAIFNCQESSDADDTTALFLFFPAEPLLTSDVIALMFGRISALGDSAPRPLVLISENNLVAVKKAFRTVGISEHCTISTYSKFGDGYRILWPVTSAAVRS
jgi:hypothetical protein